MKKLTVEKANELKAKGIQYIASVVRSKFNTVYYHINSIDALLANDGRWIPAGFNSYGWRGRVGTTGSNINWSITARTNVL